MIVVIQIRYYTGDKISEEEKKNDDSVDDDEIGIDWSNFELIDETILKKKKKKDEHGKRIKEKLD